MIVLGAGRVGQGLSRRAEAHRAEPVGLISRDEGWDRLEAPAGSPVLVAVRNDDLDDVLQRVPPSRRGDLVFLQNGAVRDWLADRGLSGATRGLLYFAVPSREAELQPGRTNWLTGPHAEAVAGWFRELELEASAVSGEVFADRELEKLLWLAVHGPLCEAHDAPVGIIAEQHRDALDALVSELLPVGAAAWGVRTPAVEMSERLADYSKSIQDFRASVKEWPWRNGWFREVAARRGIPLPLHDAILERLGHLPRE